METGEERRVATHSDLAGVLLTWHKRGTPITIGDVDWLLSKTRNGIPPEGMGFEQFFKLMYPMHTVAVGDRAQEGTKFHADSLMQQKLKDSIISSPTSGFKLGKASYKQLDGVLPALRNLVELALEYSAQDFTVYDGLRTLKEQQQHVKNGTSKTLNSMHLPQKDGFGHAVDLVPWINGAPKWDWDGCYRIACAMDRAATDLNCAHNIVWGGAWDRRLSDFGGQAHEYKKETELYASRHPGKDFLDGPHFEWRD